MVEALLNVRGHMLIQPNTHDTVLHAAISSQEPAIVEMILRVPPSHFDFSAYE